MVMFGLLNSWFAASFRVGVSSLCWCLRLKWFLIPSAFSQSRTFWWIVILPLFCRPCIWLYIIYIFKTASAEDIGQFLYHLDPDTRKITRGIEKINLKIINSDPSSLTVFTNGLGHCGSIPGRVIPKT